MPGPVTDARAGALLARYRDAFGGAELPVPVESIAEDLLGLLVEESEGLPCSGVLVPAERRIWLNAAEARQSPGRRRFTIAHELGHWVCQVQEGRSRPVYCRAADLRPDAAAGPAAPPPPNPPEEREANVFAAELLMPEEAVRNAFPRADSIEAMAAEFDVSREAMHWRLFNFGLVEERPG
ncbi:MAG: ImmA/IrrE family metallo-endopeptidase [Thermoleophilia bacterium]|nr:ImmA/IrrE family metallo-endopeptidase [Thermoleophilia bacterium]